MTTGPDFVATNFTFFDCTTYTSCTECVSSSYPCDWCVDGHRCTHDTAENCRNDILVTGVNVSCFSSFSFSGLNTLWFFGAAEDRAEHPQRPGILPSDQRDGQRVDRDPRLSRHQEEHQSQSGEHCPVYRADEFRLSVQHRGTSDARPCPAPRRHHLLRRHGVYVFVSGAQHHGHVRRHLGRIQTP